MADKRRRISNWVETTNQHTPANPFVPLPSELDRGRLSTDVTGHSKSTGRDTGRERRERAQDTDPYASGDRQAFYIPTLPAPQQRAVRVQQTAAGYPTPPPTKSSRSQSTSIQARSSLQTVIPNNAMYGYPTPPNTVYPAPSTTHMQPSVSSNHYNVPSYLSVSQRQRTQAPPTEYDDTKPFIPPMPDPPIVPIYAPPVAPPRDSERQRRSQRAAGSYVTPVQEVLSPRTTKRHSKPRSSNDSSRPPIVPLHPSQLPMPSNGSALTYPNQPPTPYPPVVISPAQQPPIVIMAPSSADSDEEMPIVVEEPPSTIILPKRKSQNKARQSNAEPVKSNPLLKRLFGGRGKKRDN